ncbi:2OG-Fe(II) oxygenase [Candidatus Entotheonella palauensis]|uniref:Prolyl 4-hydroxylase subunit alpha n=1 Tax=Candidatus Entotheonella gemina TaxID=1429439 RepID=W4M0J1_9BACT|nr:2OG-Fe(II) oxygenase [Candidatus Entotheonella palauensis]ETX03501.1 MAG: hypothetical protein ETSY2_33300 [Candidatus Entotheonella gemina]
MAATPYPAPISNRFAQLDWTHIEAQLWAFGYVHIPAVLTPSECDGLVQLYPDASYFRSRIDMARYRYGIGEYQYFDAPLPQIVQELRMDAYPPLAAIANRWQEALGLAEHYPANLRSFLAQCRAHGQTKPTPLLLRYEADGYNCLHQDLYGEIAFPLQMACFLSQPERDYTGGAFLLVEQRPRAQSRGEALTPGQGDIMIFTTRYRPVAGKRGYYRVTMRHGVSRILSGSRYTLGIIFHDAS